MATRAATSAQLVRRRVGDAREAWRGFDPRAVGPNLRRTLRPAHLTTHEWLWRAAWLPWWLGSDMPAPSLPRALPAIPAAGPAGDHVARHLRRLVHRLWIQRALLLLMRSVWLGVALGCLWVIVELLGGPDLRVTPLVVATGVLVALGLVLAACSRPTYLQVARMLDCSFSLQDRMRTAVEHFGRGVPSEGERASLVYLQMADAANVMTAVHKYPAFRPGIPVREAVLGIALGLLLGALYLIRGATGDLPDVAEAAVPGFVPAKERLAQSKEPVTRTEASLADAPTAEEVQAKAEQSNAAREDLETLADALADHPTTRAAAEAIREGDYARASQELSEASQNADQLSPAEREGLASDLDAASGAMTGENPELQEATTEAADGLREGGEPAKEGVENLSTEVGETGEEVVSQEQLAGEMREARAADQQRASQTGDQGSEQSGESSQPSDAGDPQSGESQSGDGQPSEGEAGEPGEGTDAAPGEGQEGQQGQEGDPSGESGEEGGDSDRPRSGDQGGQPGQSSQSQPGDAQQPGTSGEGQSSAGSEAPAADGQGGDQPSEQGGSQGEQAQTGSGAGGGEGTEQPGGTETGGQTGQQQDANGDGVPDTNVTEPTGGAGTGQPGEPEDPRDGITLSRSPDAEGYQTSGNAGSSSLGSGSGATAGTGATSQGEVGEAGPDANRVPQDYRDIVEDYFTEGD